MWWRVIVVCLFARCAGAGVSVRPFSFPGDVVKGESVTVACALVSPKGDAGAVRFRWLKGGRPLPPLDPRVMPRPSSSPEYSLLHVRGAEGGRDGGEYTCEAQDAAGNRDQHTAILVVHEWPEWTAAPPGEAWGVRGGDIRVDCAARGVPTPNITWARGHGTVLSDRGRHRVLSNGSLLLSDVGEEDGGEYACAASNGIGEGLRKTVMVIVHVPPRFHESSRVLRAKSGHSAVLRCDVTGDPPLKVKWTREYTDSTDTRFRVQETPLPRGGLLSSLSISRVSRKDAGLFSCTASNAHGRATTTTELTVLEPPAAPSDVTVHDVDSRQATVSWGAPHAGNSPITGYTLQYWRDTGASPRLEEAVATAPMTGHALRGLHPGTPYVVRVVAGNEFGYGPPSRPARFRTQEEAPSGYPTDLTVFSSGPKELTVQWKAPPFDQRNGVIVGYEVGVRPHPSSGSFSYREGAPQSGPVHQLVVGGLRGEGAQYEVVVRARNGAGPGPASAPPLIATTREKGVMMSAPALWVESVDATSIDLRWSAEEEASVPSYTLHYSAEGSRDWAEVEAAGGSWRLGGLREGATYHVYVRRKGGAPSPTVSARTAAAADLRHEERLSSLPSSYHATLVIVMSVVTSCVVIVCVVAGACVYVTRVTQRGDFAEQHSFSGSRSIPISPPLLYPYRPGPYPSPYATLPLRPAPVQKRWGSEEGGGMALSERSSSDSHQWVEEEKMFSHLE